MDVLEAAKQLGSLVEKEAQRVGVPVTFCVIDIHGNVVLKQRMTGSMLLSIEMSERKAYTSAALPMRTADMMPLSQPGGGLYTLASVSAGHLTMFGGGVPLYLEGAHLGGAGVSGGTTEQDVEIIEAAFKKFLSAS
jgi:uncharacterized protein GlcG (DUF336 family)